jgi:hypothetical protein
MSPMKNTCREFEYIIILITYYYLLQVSALSGQSSGRNQMQDMYEAVVCIITRIFSLCMYKAYYQVICNKNIK